jgi:hypothetical protein
VVRADVEEHVLRQVDIAHSPDLMPVHGEAEPIVRDLLE